MTRAQLEQPLSRGRGEDRRMAAAPGTSVPDRAASTCRLRPGSDGDLALRRREFQDDVRRIQEYIAAGDTFQTVLSRRLDLAAPDPLLTYRYLRALNPAPYLYFLHCDDLHIVGSSPEVLVRVEDGEVTLRPIAGTRPRGRHRRRPTRRSPPSWRPTPRSGPST